MTTNFSVRSAGLEDRRAVIEVVREAFSQNGSDGQEEMDIVVNTWAMDATEDGLELVAVASNRVVGYALAARGDVGGRAAVGVAPLAVAPPQQGRGVGTALMTELVRRAEAAGFPLLALLGSPAYYQRFGFEPSGPLGIVYPLVGAGHPHFQIRRLGRFDPSYCGDFRYCWERSDGLRVRRARPPDVEPAAAVWLRSRRASVPAIPPPVHADEDVHRWFGETVMVEREMWVAEVGGAIVGLMVLDANWLDQLYVDPALTGHGVGSALLSVAKVRSPTGLDLWTFASNLGARGFYEARGFTAVEMTDGSRNEEQAPDVRYQWRPPAASGASDELTRPGRK